MKKFILCIFLAAVALILAACDGYIEIAPEGQPGKRINIVIRDGYYLTTNRPLYDIVDTENGYDIIIHAYEVGK